MPADLLDVPRCLQQVQAGDQSAARALVDHLYPLVYKLVRAHRPRRVAEEDLAQEIFVKVFQRLTQYHGRDGVPFEHWVSRVAVTTCLDALRAEKRRPEWRWSDLSDGERDWIDFFAGAESTPSDALSAREAAEKLLAYLSPDDRLLLTLLDLEDRPGREVSQMTGWSLTAVKVRAFRARQKLRKYAIHLKKESKL